MTMLSKICTATVLLGTLCSGSVLAHSAPYTHYHPTPKKKKNVKVIYRTTPTPPSRVVIVEKKTVVRPKVTITRPVVVVETRREERTETATTSVSARSESEDTHLPLSIGVRGLGAQSSMEDGIAGEVAMGGAGATIRSKLPDGFGVELSADVLAGEGPGFDQMSIPVFASASYHFLPDSLLQPYVLMGVGVEFGRREFLGGSYTIDSIDVGAQAGVGAELFLTDAISLTGDVRFKAMGTVKREDRVREDCIVEAGTMTGFCDNIQSATSGGDTNLGIQFGVGANIYF